MPTESSYPLTRYAATMVAHMRRPIDPHTIVPWLILCATIDGWHEFPGGFVAWFRCGFEHLGACRRKDWSALAVLPHAVLTGGPVLVIAECLALEPGVIHKELRRLIRESGCAAVAAWRDEGRRWKLQRVRRYELRCQQEQE